MVLIEAQSSVNENMPLRLLIYISRVYEKIVDQKKVYNRKLIQIPKPEFIVIYNGREDYPEQNQLKLSDAFTDAVTKELLELTVTVYNVNSGYNTEILERCKPLNDYATFFARIREDEANGLSFDDAVAESIDYCIGHGIMAGYLEAHSSEVRNMLFTEYNLEDDKQASFDEGKAEGKTETARSMKSDGMEAALISKYTGLGVEEINDIKV